jgi:hypothetical protein
VNKDRIEDTDINVARTMNDGKKPPTDRASERGADRPKPVADPNEMKRDSRTDGDDGGSRGSIDDARSAEVVDDPENRYNQ